MKYLFRIMVSWSLLFPAAGWANRLHSAYSIPHGSSDRVIFEFDHRTDYRMVASAEDQIQVIFEDAELSTDFGGGDLPDQLSMVRSLDSRCNEAGELVVTIQLQRPAEPTGMTLNANPWRYALDLAPKSAGPEQSSPPFIRGERPIHTTHSDAGQSNDESAKDVRFSRNGFIFAMLLAFIAGAMSVFATGYGLQRLRKRFPRAPEKSSSPASPRELLHLELERDLARLKRTVEWESTEMSDGTRQLHDQREQLILRMLKEGRQLDAIAEALSMTPDQIRQILERHS